MNELVFRLAGPGDAGTLAAFMTRNFLATYGECSTPENVAAAVAEHYGIEAQLLQLADPARINLLAEREGQLAGHAQLRFGGAAPAAVTPLPAAEIARFYVDVDFHGRGIAQAMMAQVLRLGAERGGASLYLSCWQQQPQAIRFYEKEGFRIVGTLVFKIGNDPKDDWLMLRTI